MRFSNLYLKFFSKQKVGRQLITLFFCIILLPVFVLSCVIYFFSSTQMANNYASLTEAKASQIRSVLVTTTLALNETYETVMRDESLQNLLMKTYTDEDAVIDALSGYDTLDNLLKNQAALTDIRLYVRQDNIPLSRNYTHFYPITEETKSEDWYKKANSQRANFWRSDLYTSPNNASPKSWALKYYCRIPIPRINSDAFLVMTVSNNHLKNMFRMDDYEVYLSVNKDPVFLSSQRNASGNDFPIDISFSSAFHNEAGKMEIDGATTMVAVQTFCSNTTKDQFKILVTNPKAVPYLQRINLTIILIGLSVLTVSALLIYLYATYFSARIQTLRLAMHKVSHNDYEIVNSIQGDDELSATFQDLKVMIAKLKETEAKIYKAQIKEQELSNQQQQMELKLLANQINPHFLYNTLEMIRMKAFSNGDRDVAKAIKLLGKSMRYVLNNTKSTATTLDKEIDYISSYLQIQKLRFEEQMDYAIEIDDNLDLKSCQILPLLIQPLVENAISHGLADTEKNGRIIFKLYRTSNDLLVAEVFDNGYGMTQEKLADVIAHLDVPQNELEHGVGLYNINNRVHLFYGNEYGLHIKSRPGEGTQVTLTVPLLNLTEEET